jgi:phage tail-like protein
MAAERDFPYSQFSFRVEIENSPDAGSSIRAGFQEVTGLSLESTEAEYRAGNTRGKVARKITGTHKVPDVTLKRGVIGDLKTLYRWIDEVRNGSQTALRTVTVQLLSEDRSRPVQEWKLVNARPIKYTGPALSGQGTDVAIEELVLASERIEPARNADPEVWPSLPLEEWKDTNATLHMWTQIVGKTRLALCPRENHWWHVALYVTARGLTTMAIPHGTRVFEVEFDFVDHQLTVLTSDGGRRGIPLDQRSVADFYRQYMAVLDDLGLSVRFRPVPDEVEHPIPFAEDRQHASYDPEQANRFWRVLLQADRILKRFRGRFLGKSSPVHFFWGSFDLALTRFSGRRAPARPGADRLMQEAASHEEISVGFWPGSGAVPEPAFYGYVVPEPPGFATATVKPPAAQYRREISNFVLPYESARTVATPDEIVLAFFQSTYEAAADLAGWDRAALDRPESEWG